MQNTGNHLATISKEEKILKDFVAQFVLTSYKKLPEKEVVLTLKEYTQKHLLSSEEEPLSDEYLKSVGMYDILHAVFEVLVIAKESKLGTIILHGVPNSGKSSIMRIINEIFICDYIL